MDKITAKQVVELKDSGHVVYSYPRKKVICVDGFKYFSAEAGALSAASPQKRELGVTGCGNTNEAQS